MGIVIETLVLQAVALDGQGRTDGALDALFRALSLARPEGYVRVFVDQGPQMAKLLTQIGASLASNKQPPANDGLRAYVAGLLKAFARQGSRPQVSGVEFVPKVTTAPERHNSVLSGAEEMHPEAFLLDPLTGREIEVLHLLVAGLSNREIAQRLTITLGTAKRHVSNIYAKLDVHSRVQAIVRAQALHLV
jgi:LuxR family maltose regulon positive regulatory protein